MNAGLQDCPVLFLFLSTRIIFFSGCSLCDSKSVNLVKKSAERWPLHLILQLLRRPSFWFVFSFLLYFFIDLFWASFLVIMQHTTKCLGVAYECDLRRK